MKFRKRPDILISLNAAKARFEFLTFITKQKLSAHFYPLRTNRSVRFDFSVATVILGCSGYQVSFYTTVGDQMLNYQLIGLEEQQVSHLH